MDTEWKDPGQELVKIQDPGICKHQHAGKVMKINLKICFTNLKFVDPLICYLLFPLFFVTTFTVTCNALSAPSNGGRTYNRNSVGGKYPVDTVVTFTCNSGYSRSGSSTRKCQTSGNWNSNSPTCNKSNNNLIILLISCTQRLCSFYSV